MEVAFDIGADSGVFGGEFELSASRLGCVVRFLDGRVLVLGLSVGINVVFKQRTGVSHTSIPRGGEVQGIRAQVSFSLPGLP